MANDPIEVRLGVVVEKRKVTASLAFINKSSSTVFLWKPHAMVNGEMENNLFEIYCGDQRIPYTGRMVKRGEQTRADFFELAPGQPLPSVVQLHDYYDFPPGATTCRAWYQAYNAYPDQPGFFLLKSNEVTIRLTA